ncbi:MAG: stage III sporulation protein AG [Lachnospiraceae bacterium]|nr:stage III sporulation protein AG [Lachnospiraceae bacterium]
MEQIIKMKEMIRQIGYIRLVLLLVCGIFLILVSIPEKKEELTGKENDDNQPVTDYKNDENDIFVEKMENRLAEILEMIDGAGRVNVMITLAASSEAIVNKDQIYEEEADRENSENGKENTKTIRKEETILSEKEGDLNPYIVKTMEPVIEGVIIVMEGGDNSFVASAVTEAVQALFPVEAHKIKVLKMEDGA